MIFPASHDPLHPTTSSMDQRLLSSLCLAGLAVYLTSRWLSRKRANPQGYPYPPGPKPEFLVGNLRHMPKRAQWLEFTKLGKLYGIMTQYLPLRVFDCESTGNIIHFEMLRKHIIVIDSLSTADELLSKAAAIYSGRSHATMVYDL